jgi:uncharacterized protein
LKPERLTSGQARRIALAAQGFRRDRPERPGARHLERMFERLGLVQIDSVNVLARAHYVPFYSRSGAYDAALLDRAAYGKPRALFEYWGHEASLLRLDLYPLMRWRMERAARSEGIYGGLARFAAERRPFIDAVLGEVAARGALTARELADGGRGRGSWWGWSDGKRALEWLFWSGLVTTASRRGFERVYDLTERVLPDRVVSAPPVATADAQRALIGIAARALGIATERDLRDYFRLAPEDARPRIAELVEDGALVPVAVQGWNNLAYLDPAARLPRKIAARALVSPFDPLLWERSRTERLFGVRYRIEIYTPVHKREFGYYVLPFLLGDRIVARLDLKADRVACRLLVHAVHLEPWSSPDETVPALRDELRALADWLGLADVVVTARSGAAALL